MNKEKVKLIAHNLKLLAESLEDAFKEDPESYLQSGIDPTPYTYKDEYEGN